MERISDSEFRHGLIVWVPSEAGREERVCVLDGEVKKFMTLPDWNAHKKRIAESNRLKNLGRFRGKKKETLARHGILSSGLTGEPA